jgi:peptidoglycan/xylan/chitin deacetylase (PgdA/CDA1 family)
MKFVVLFVIVALSVLGSSLAFAVVPLTKAALIAESCRLVEEQRYADAVVMAERLHIIYPNDPASLETDGAVALQVGAVKNAEAYFNKALSLAPSDPRALYGMSLVALLRNQNARSLGDISAINLELLSPEAAEEVSLVKSICLLQTANAGAAVANLNEDQAPAAFELTALVKFRQSSGENQILKDWLVREMVDGIPNVVELPGLRLLIPDNASGPAIEPSVTAVDTQADLANRFDSSFVSGGLRTLTGTVSVGPPRPVMAGTDVIAFSVDSNPVGESNLPSSLFQWDTHSVPNGEHALNFSLLGDTGAPIGIQVEDVYVLNRDVSDDDSSDIPADLSDRIWRLMQIRPNDKVVDYELALALRIEHDQSGYETYILRTAALDPDYRDARSRIHPLFVGQVPDVFPVPDGTTLPSSLGLSAGSASKAGFWAGSPNIREIALTFDDGPIPDPTKQLLDALRSSNAIGTFFVVGMRAAASPGSLRQMAADGDDVEDHSFTHPNLTQILPQHILQEILRPAVVIQATTGLWPHFLRPPGGNTSPLVLETAKICGMSGAFWTIDALPAEESGSPTEIVSWIVSRAKPGAIVLLHNGMVPTVAAIPALVDELRQHGYKLVTLRQLALDALASHR